MEQAGQSSQEHFDAWLRRKKLSLTTAAAFEFIDASDPAYAHIGFLRTPVVAVRWETEPARIA